MGRSGVEKPCKCSLTLIGSEPAQQSTPINARAQRAGQTWQKIASKNMDT